MARKSIRERKYTITLTGQQILDLLGTIGDSIDHIQTLVIDPMAKAEGIQARNI